MKCGSEEYKKRINDKRRKELQLSKLFHEINALEVKSGTKSEEAIDSSNRYTKYTHTHTRVYGRQPRKDHIHASLDNKEILLTFFFLN